MKIKHVSLLRGKCIWNLSTDHYQGKNLPRSKNVCMVFWLSIAKERFCLAMFWNWMQQIKKKCDVTSNSLDVQSTVLDWKWMPPLPPKSRMWKWYTMITPWFREWSKGFLFQNCRCMYETPLSLFKNSTILEWENKMKSQNKHCLGKSIHHIFIYLFIYTTTAVVLYENKNQVRCVEF